MSDFEFFGTISAFIAGIGLLVYLFRTRHTLIRKARLQMLLAKAKLHYMTRPQEEDLSVPLEYEHVDIAEAVTPSRNKGWSIETYRERETR